jgi:2-iminobutanoate/2-iminopropanoate deaminase
MDVDSTVKSVPDRANETSRKQRDGTEFIGVDGEETGESDLRFIERQLPEDGDQMASDASPIRRLELCLHNLERELEHHGNELGDILQLTLYLTEMNAYEQANSTYEQCFDEEYSICTTVGVCELLGGAAVPINTAAAVE